MSYFFVYFFSSLFILCSSLKQQKYIKFLLIVLSFLVLSIFFAGRGENVGTDVRIYALPVFVRCLAYSDLYQLSSREVLEKGYLLMNYLVSRYSDDYHFAFLLNAFLFLLGFFVGGYYFSKKFVIPIFFVFILFLLTQFNMGMNLIRQFISVSIIFGFSFFLIQKKIIVFFLGVLFALCFHHSAIIGVVIYLLYHVTIFFLESKNRQFYLTFLFFGITIAVLNFPFLTHYFINIGLLSARVENDLDSYSVQTGSLMLAICKSVPFILGVISYKTLSKIEKPFVVFAYIVLLLAIVRTNFGAASRLLIYFDSYSLISIPLFVYRIFINKRNRYIVCLILFLFYS